jgi:hypothetical protein
MIAVKRPIMIRKKRSEADAPLSAIEKRRATSRMAAPGRERQFAHGAAKLTAAAPLEIRATAFGCGGQCELPAISRHTPGKTRRRKAAIEASRIRLIKRQ